MAVDVQKFTLIFLISLFVCVNSWKSCEETFCDRVRERPQGGSRNVNLDFSKSVLKLSNESVETNLYVDGTPLTLKFKLEVVGDSSFHIFIDQSASRYRANKALTEVLPSLIIDAKQTNNTLVTVIHGDNKALIYSKPFKVEFYSQDTLLSIANWNNSLIFKTEANQHEIALDILFPNVQRAYGIPEHADRLTLQNTRLNQPYRLFNVDYGNYKINSTEALYGSIPVLYAHGVEQSSGIFWLNPSQTWVDVTTSPNDVDAYFMSEDGPLDMYFLMGPTLQQAVTQYTKLTGTAPLPQYFTLGYHQSRYSYKSQDEVISIVDSFDEYNLPVDVVWLDIDYTDEKKYFTWDPKRFKDPEKLLNDLKRTDRKLVAIIDPHFKNDAAYDVHQTAKQKGYYVKNTDNTDYSDRCWPDGLSSWLDFLNPQALDFYSDLYKRKGFDQSNIHIWNDMNEPAVFNDRDPSLEKTMPLNLIHYNNRKHQEVHNIYGFYQTVGTQKGLLNNNPNLRPFILTRSHFAGIQRYAAIWTGDNYANWDHLRISLPMCLTEALAGVSFCGADVGGFGGIPDDELYQRWYQVGAWLPFYRAHSAVDVPRREPYLYPEGIQARVRTALHQRYTHLPLWYTLFREHELTGEPVIRPITYHYPKEVDALSIDNQILVGPNVLVAPVLEPGISSKQIYLPGGKSQIWYNIDDNNKAIEGSGFHTINVNLNSIPVFYRAGSIIPRKDILRPTSVGTYQDPFTLYICLNDTGEANGTLYVDDYESFKYKDNEFLHTTLIFTKNTLSSQSNGGTYSPSAKIEQLIILNPPKSIVEVKYTADKDSATAKSIQYDNERNLLNITGIEIDLQKKFQVEFFETTSNDATILKLSRWMLVVIISFVLM